MSTRWPSASPPEGAANIRSCRDASARCGARQPPRAPATTPVRQAPLGRPQGDCTCSYWTRRQTSPMTWMPSLTTPSRTEQRLGAPRGIVPSDRLHRACELPIEAKEAEDCLIKVVLGVRNEGRRHVVTLARVIHPCATVPPDPKAIGAEVPTVHLRADVAAAQPRAHGVERALGMLPRLDHALLSTVGTYAFSANASSTLTVPALRAYSRRRSCIPCQGYITSS